MGKTKKNSKMPKGDESKQNHEVEIEKSDEKKLPVTNKKKKPQSDKQNEKKKTKKRKAENENAETEVEVTESPKKEKQKKIKEPAVESATPKKKKKKNEKPEAENEEESPKKDKKKKKKEEPASELPTPKKKNKKSDKTADGTEEENPDDPEEKKPYAYDRADEKKTVFCGNIPNETGMNKTKIKDLFAQYGKIKTVRMRSETGNILFSQKNKKLCTSFNAYVVFETVEDAKKSLQLNGYKLMDSHLRVNMANDKKTAFQSKGTVFVGNLPFDATEKEVHDHFATIGDIDYVRIIPRKGIAYICYQKGVSIANALKLNESEFQGRNIRVTRCETKQKQEKKRLYKRDPKTGRKIKLRVKKSHKLNENFIQGRGSKGINNPIIKKIKDSQKAKFNKFTESANQVSKKDLFRRGGKLDKDNRDASRLKFKQKKTFTGSRVDDGKKSKKGKITKNARDQKVIAKKLKSAAMRTIGK